MSTSHRSHIALATTTAAILASLALPGSPVLASGPSPRAVQVCWDFSTLQQAVPYRLGDTFLAPSATIEMKHYLWNGNLNSNPAGRGQAHPSQIAGGPAPEFWLYLLNAHVVPNTPLNTVTFAFGLNVAQGTGHANLGVNGELVEVTTSLADLDQRELGDPAIGTALVTVTMTGAAGANYETGTVQLQAMTGQIEKFTIGGIQLDIDNVCMQ